MNSKDLNRSEAILKLESILSSEDVVLSIRNNLEELLTLISEINYMIGFEHKHPHHHLDVWEHTLLALSLSENILEIRLVLLLHDIGKPFSFVEGEVRNFRNHPKVSSTMSRKILLRLGYEESFINEVCYLIEFHDTPISSQIIHDNFELAYKQFQVQRCDALAHHPDMLEKRKIYIEKMEKVLKK